MLLTATSMARAPDLYVNSAVDPTPWTWRRSSRWSAAMAVSVAGRTGASCMAPPDLLAPERPIMGGDELHQHLVGILRSLGHRTEPARSTP